MAPVVLKLRERPELTVKVVVTAQHRELADDALIHFGLKSDFDLDLMKSAQTLGSFSGRCLAALDECFAADRPDYVVAQGDTSTVLSAALAAYYRGIPFGHVEAGLRSGDFANPFPEEMNRVIISRLATHHFCPTPGAEAALLEEGYNPKSIYVTGNSVIDALLITHKKSVVPRNGKRILVTLHRRENFGRIQEAIAAVRGLLVRFPDLQFIWPVHPNPSVSGPVFAALSNEPRVSLVAPLSYPLFIQEMAASVLILTDSGGVQEEAPALGVPVLVLRAETERPEGVAAGVSRLVGLESKSIISEVSRLLCEPDAYAVMAKGGSPYGDGRASDRIAEVISSLARAKAA